MAKDWIRGAQAGQSSQMQPARGTLARLGLLSLHFTQELMGSTAMGFRCMSRLAAYAPCMDRSNFTGRIKLRDNRSKA